MVGPRPHVPPLALPLHGIVYKESTLEDLFNITGRFGRCSGCVVSFVTGVLFIIPHNQETDLMT